MAEDKQAEKSAKAELKELRSQAKDGVLKAQFLLAVKLANGDGGEADAKNAKEAEKWYRKAAKRDFPPAMNNLALLYTSGALGEPDLKAALKWYRKAAELGYARAQAILGWRLVRGNGVTANESEGAALLTKAAEQGFALAQNNLGVCFSEGTGVDADEAQAVGWFRKSRRARQRCRAIQPRPSLRARAQRGKRF